MQDRHFNYSKNLNQVPMDTSGEVSRPCKPLKQLHKSIKYGPISRACNSQSSYTIVFTLSNENWPLTCLQGLNSTITLAQESYIFPF